VRPFGRPNVDLVGASFLLERLSMVTLLQLLSSADSVNSVDFYDLLELEQVLLEEEELD